MELFINKKPLPSNCYSSDRSHYQPRLLEHKGIVQHFISAKNIDSANAYDIDLCFKIFKDYKVSAHFLIARDGSIYQMVPLEYQAWHAGKSQFHNRTGCNGFMIGIENIGAYKVPFTDEQYESNARLCAGLSEIYGIDSDWITGHEDIAPGRKVDPGPSWNWNLFYNLLSIYKDDVMLQGLL